MTFLFSALLLLAACGLIKDAAVVTIETQLTSVMQVTVSGTKSAELSSGINDLPFSEEQVLDLKSNTELVPYLDDIREIEFMSILVDIYGVTGEQVVYSLLLDAKGVGTIATIKNITPMQIAYPPEIDFAKLEEAGKQLKQNKKITLVVHGEANMPMSFNIQMTFPIEVVAGVLD